LYGKSRTSARQKRGEGESWSKTRSKAKAKPGRVKQAARGAVKAVIATQ
jgi:hypothetical protein